MSLAVTSRLSFSQRLQRSRRRQKSQLSAPPCPLRPGPDALTISEFQDPGSLLPQQSTPISAQFFKSKLPQSRDLLVLKWASGHFAALNVSRPNRHGVRFLAGTDRVPLLEARTQGHRTLVITHEPSKLVLRLTCKISP